MYSVELKIQDSVIDKLLYFLDNLPKNDVQIVSKTNVSEDNLSDELLARIDDVKNDNVNTLSRKEIFEDF